MSSYHFHEPEHTWRTGHSKPSYHAFHKDLSLHIDHELWPSPPFLSAAAGDPYPPTKSVPYTEANLQAIVAGMIELDLPDGCTHGSHAPVSLDGGKYWISLDNETFEKFYRRINPDIVINLRGKGSITTEVKVYWVRGHHLDNLSAANKGMLLGKTHSALSLFQD